MVERSDIRHLIFPLYQFLFGGSDNPFEIPLHLIGEGHVFMAGEKAFDFLIGLFSHVQSAFILSLFE
jgi:hypothetical protein